MSSAARRLQVVVGHLGSDASTCHDQPAGLQAQPCAAAIRTLPHFNPQIMEAYLDDMRDLKRKIYDVFLVNPELLPPTTEGMSKEQHRALVRRCLRALLDAGLSPLHLLDSDQRKYYYLGECLALVDLSTTVKSGVQYSLWGGSIINLGTESHRKKYFDDIASLRLPGCFAMTELKHGSNVAALQTEAVLDTATDEWVIHTPDEGAIKWWIGNAAEDGKAATVFARLKVPAPKDAAGAPAMVDHGVHAFVVPIRDDAGRTLPGVEIRDCGYKVGLQGIDNGAIRFTHVRVPRVNLLDRFASVDRSGTYASPLASESRRFAVTLGELTGGRVGLVSGSVGVLKGAATIAIRYSAQRQQFGPPGGAEISVLDYQTQQTRLMPVLATAYALHWARDGLVAQYCEMKKSRDPRLVEEVHALSAGLKAYTTAYTNAALSTCRECCGGHGYAAVNRLGALRSDHDIFQTFEGDNTVLMQQVTTILLKGYKQRFAGAPLASSLHYLRGLMSGVLPANPLASHDTEPGRLRDPEFLRRALRHRTGRMLFTLSLRLRKHVAKVGPFHAWNKCLNHIQALANAHIESVIVDAALHKAAACKDRDCRRALKAMADLFALQCIEADLNLRNDDYVAPSQAKAIKKLIEQLCLELRGVALPLVDAFAIPDHILRAPIGLGAASGVDIYKEYLHAAGFDD